MNVLLFAAALAALVPGANLLVRGASELALSFGISRLVVGLTGVAFGTSAPAAAASITAALEEQHDALPAFSTAMMSFVIPITVITLVAVMLRKPKADTTS